MSALQSFEVTSQTLEEMQKRISSYADVQTLLSLLTEANASLAFDVLMSACLIFQASDLHIDSNKNGARIRIRIDSVLYDLATIDSHLYALVMYRARLLSKIKININDAQDGRFTLKTPDRDIEIRTSTIPSEYGQDVALRFLDPVKLMSISDLGIRDDVFQIFQEQIKHPNGLFVVTGPTGAGKTTTLYAVIKFLQTPAIKIITIEDPIEYHLQGISQSQVDDRNHYTFEQGLRSILRQDPDIVMMGELRGLDSANPALQASLAGRRIFTTLHTNDSVGVVARLKDMGVSQDTIASGLKTSLAQRMLRRLCNACKVQRNATQTEKGLFTRMLQNAPERITQGLSFDVVYEPAQQHCDSCKGYGFKGMIGVFEIFVNTEEISHAINQGSSEYTLKEMAKKQEMTTMQQDAILRILQGVTSLEEARRILILE